MTGLEGSVRHALRSLGRRPSFALLAILILAIGIAPSISIFSVIQGVVLNPLPVDDLSSLVDVREQSLERGWPEVSISLPNLIDYREQSRVFQDIGAYMPHQVNLTETEDPQRLSGQKITSNLFPILGVTPLLGRVFTPEEEMPGSTVVVVSHGLWQARLGGSRDLSGRTLRLDGVPHTVVGVMPEGFVFPSNETEIWLPLGLDPSRETRDGRRSIGVARLADGVALEQAQLELAQISRALEESYPETNDGFEALVRPLYDTIYGSQFASTWLTVQRAVFLLLLVAISNVVCLLLAQGIAREKELAICSALGSGRQRLITYFLVESTLLATAGGLLSIVLAHWGNRLVLALIPSNLPGVSNIGLNLGVVGFSIALVVLASSACGLLVGLFMSRPDLAETLRTVAGRGSLGSGSQRLRSGIVVLGIALTLMLLITTGLFVQSFSKLQSLPRGFQPQDLLTVRLTFSPSEYPNLTQHIDRLTERLGSLPGVVSVGAINELPTGQHINWVGSFTAEGSPPPPKGQEPMANTRVVTPGYFHTMGIPLLAGSALSNRHRADTSKVVLINQNLADQLFGDKNPVGQTIVSGIPVDRLQVIGVVGNVRQSGPREPIRSAVYYPYTQFPWPTVSFILRTQKDSPQMASVVRQAIQDVVPTQPIYSFQSMQAAMDRDVSEDKALTAATTFFMPAALLLAASGLYGVLSFSAARKTKEVGLRLALGAPRGDVLRLILREGLILCLAGLALGTAASLAAGRVVSSLLFEMEAFHLGVFLSACLVMALAALIASIIPAMRLLSVDPMIALRDESGA